VLARNARAGGVERERQAAERTSLTLEPEPPQAEAGDHRGKAEQQRRLVERHGLTIDAVDTDDDEAAD
jgi:hypothetical protein